MLSRRTTKCLGKGILRRKCRSSLEEKTPASQSVVEDTETYARATIWSFRGARCKE